MSTWQVLRRGTAVAVSGVAMALAISVTSGPAAAQDTIVCVSKRLGLMRVVEDAWQCRSWETVRFLAGAGSGIKFAFVTSQAYDLTVMPSSCPSCGTALERADFECNKLAGLASLPGTYVAWLSDALTDAADRLPDIGGPWYNTRAELIAVDLAMLTNTDNIPLFNPISYDEFHESLDPASIVITGTDADGTATGQDCSSWTVTGVSPPFHTAGDDTAISSEWTNNGGNTTCSVNVNRHFYCFQE